MPFLRATVYFAVCFFCGARASKGYYGHIGRYAVSPAGCVHAVVGGAREGGPAEDLTRLTGDARSAAVALRERGRPREEREVAHSGVARQPADARL